MNDWSMFEQQYDYDALNRLQRVADNLGTPSWQQHYTYDRWGNRTVDTDTSGLTPRSCAASVATNKLYASGETDQNHPLIDYDAAGNQKKDWYTDNYSGVGKRYDRVYDAENRMTSSTTTFSDNSTQPSTYVYDGDGRRIKRSVGGVETWQVYGLGGELLAEYAANAAPATPQKEYGYRNGELLVTADAPTGAGPTNVALASNGGVATASSSYPSTPTEDDSPATTNNGDRKGKVGSIPSVWNDAGPANTFDDWLQVDFNGSKTIGEIDVFTLQDNWQNPSEPTEAMTFSSYGITSYDVQYWNGSSWVTVSGGSVTGNNKVWRKFTFAAVTTSKVRVLTHASGDGYSRVAELEAWTASTAQLHWLVADQLGTPRMVFDESGDLTVTNQNGQYVSGVTRHDYLPFGEELGAGVGGRTTAQGYSDSDGIRQQFTSKERDNETGLDYFLARYYSSTQGRFTSPDPLLMTQERTLNPQGLNLYTYCINNPLSNTDPDGRYFVGTDGERVEYEIKKGTIIFKTKNASDDLKRLANLISASGSKKALSQFTSLADNDTKIHLKIETEPNAEKPGLLGYHQPHDRNGNALEWDPQKGNFNGDIAYITDKNGNLAYQEATITIYEGNINNSLEGLQMQYHDPQLTTEDYMVATFSHEGDHDLNQKAIGAIKRRQEGDERKFDVFKVVEKPAYKVTDKVVKEIKNSRPRVRD